MQTVSSSWQSSFSAGRRPCVRVNALTAHYQVLGVPVNAPFMEVKQAFRKKAKQLHPDHNRNEGAAQQFKVVRAAYLALAEMEKKRTLAQAAQVNTHWQAAWSPENARRTSSAPSQPTSQQSAPNHNQMHRNHQQAKASGSTRSSASTQHSQTQQKHTSNRTPGSGAQSDNCWTAGKSFINIKVPF